MGTFDRSYYNLLDRYNFIRETTTPLSNPQGPKADEFLKKMEDLKQMYSANDPNADSEFEKFSQWYRDNRNDIIGQSGSSPVQVGTATKNAGDTQTGNTAPATTPTTQTGAAPAVASTTQPSTTTQPGAEITTQQKDLFRKLHGTSYNPNSSMDKAKMGQLQSAGGEVGYNDVNKLANSAYSKQYAGTSKASTYPAKAPATTPTTPSAQPFQPTASTQAAAPSQPGAPSINLQQPIKMNLSSPAGVAPTTPVYQTINKAANKFAKPTQSTKPKQTV